VAKGASAAPRTTPSTVPAQPNCRKALPPRGRSPKQSTRSRRLTLAYALTARWPDGASNSSMDADFFGPRNITRPHCGLVAFRADFEGRTDHTPQSSSATSGHNPVGLWSDVTCPIPTCTSGTPPHRKMSMRRDLRSISRSAHSPRWKLGRRRPQKDHRSAAEERLRRPPQTPLIDASSLSMIHHSNGVTPAPEPAASASSR